MAENAGLIAFTVILILVLMLLFYFLARHFGFKKIISKLFGYESSSSDEERSILSKYEQLQNESIEDSKELLAKETKTPVSPPFQNHQTKSDTNPFTKQTVTSHPSSPTPPPPITVVKPTDLKPTWLSEEFNRTTTTTAVRNGDMQNNQFGLQGWTDFKQALKSPTAQPQFRYIVTQDSIDSAASAGKAKISTEKAPANERTASTPLPPPPKKKSNDAASPPQPITAVASAAAAVISGGEQLQSPSPSRVASPRGSGEFDSDSMLILDDDKSSRRTSISSIDSSLDEISLNNTLTRALSTDSVDSTYSMTDFTAESEIGQLEVRLQYDSANQYLFIWILQAYDVRLTTGPDVELWVVLFLLPHPKPLWRTQLQKYAPVVSFHEKFRQRVRDQDLKKLACLCQLYSRKSSAVNGNELLGQAKVRLKDIELAFANTIWLTLLPVSADAESVGNGDNQLGEIFFSLNYLPTAERLTVVIAKVRNLRDNSGDVPKHAMVRVYLVQGAKVSRKKTSSKSVVDGSITFNESMIFSLSQNHVPKVSLRLSVVHLVKNSNEQSTIGQVTVGARRTGKEFGHWQKMIEQPRKPASMWHSLMPKKQP